MALAPGGPLRPGRIARGQNNGEKCPAQLRNSALRPQQQLTESGDQATERDREREKSHDIQEKDQHHHIPDAVRPGPRNPCRCRRHRRARHGRPGAHWALRVGGIGEHPAALDQRGLPAEPHPGVPQYLWYLARSPAERRHRLAGPRQLERLRESGVALPDLEGSTGKSGLRGADAARERLRRVHPGVRERLLQLLLARFRHQYLRLRPRQLDHQAGLGIQRELVHLAGQQPRDLGEVLAADRHLGTGHRAGPAMGLERQPRRVSRAGRSHPRLPRRRLREHDRGRQLRHVSCRDHQRGLEPAAQWDAGPELLARVREGARQEVRGARVGQRHHQPVQGATTTRRT